MCREQHLEDSGKNIRPTCEGGTMMILLLSEWTARS